MAKNLPRVSVVLPFHDAAKWLPATLESLRRQRNIRLHVIAIDDGSTDSSATEVVKSAKRGLPITLLRNETNLGIVASLNRGLDLADTSFIARMDADDICTPERLASQVAFLERTGYEACGSWFTEFGQGFARVVRWPHSEPALRAAMLFQNTICHPTLIAKRTLFERYRYREEYRLAEDYDLFVRALAEFRMANVPEPLLRYRRHRQQATQAKRGAMEQITQRIRVQALQAQGIESTPEEQRIHNLVRATQSNHSMEDFEHIEAWLLKLIDHFDHPDAKRTIASQWTRAAVRAAPLGRLVWRKYRASPLHAMLSGRISSDIDLAVLTAVRLDYGSRTFDVLRRFGLSA